MTDITLEQRARELLAAEYEREGLTYMVDDLMHPDAEFTPATNRTLRAIEAALRLSAGADWVLMPREPTLEMFIAGAAVDDDTCETYRAMIAAAPRHEPGEG